MKFENVYPDIAQTVLKSISIPVLSKEARDAYVRPDTFHLYIPSDYKYESDEDTKRENERRKVIRKYKHRRIDRVTKKSKNATGQVKYTVIFEDSPKEVTVPSKALQDHEDWDLVEHFEYQQSIRRAIRDGI